MRQRLAQAYIEGRLIRLNNQRAADKRKSGRRGRARGLDHEAHAGRVQPARSRSSRSTSKARTGSPGRATTLVEDGAQRPSAGAAATADASTSPAGSCGRRPTRSRAARRTSCATSSASACSVSRRSPTARASCPGRTCPGLGRERVGAAASGMKRAHSGGSCAGAAPPTRRSTTRTGHGYLSLLVARPGDPARRRVGTRWRSSPSAPAPTSRPPVRCGARSGSPTSPTTSPVVHRVPTSRRCGRSSNGSGTRGCSTGRSNERCRQARVLSSAAGSRRGRPRPTSWRARSAPRTGAGLDDEELAEMIAERFDFEAIARLIDHVAPAPAPRRDLAPARRHRPERAGHGRAARSGSSTSSGTPRCAEELDDEELATLVAALRRPRPRHGRRRGRTDREDDRRRGHVRDRHRGRGRGEIAVTLTERPRGRGAPADAGGSRVRPVAVAGRRLLRPVVNLASRLTELARPGTVLASAELASALAGDEGFRSAGSRAAASATSAASRCSASIPALRRISPSYPC